MWVALLTSVQVRDFVCPVAVSGPIMPCNVCGDADCECDCKPFICADASYVIARNPSAFFVDGVHHKDCWNLGELAPKAQIKMDGWLRCLFPFRC